MSDEFKETVMTVSEVLTNGYKAIEKTVAGTCKKTEDSFVNAFLKENGETVEEAKDRSHSAAR